MTYRERREARAARLREWADKRQARATADFAHVDSIADAIPFGQPILVGHHSEKRHRAAVNRMEVGMRRGVDNYRTAQRMNAKADNIERAADHAIYSDDDDAVPRLRERIAALEAERQRIKDYNKSCRAGARDLSILDAAQKEMLGSLARVASFQIGPRGELPSYASSNLSGNISRLKKRLAELEG